ncbi:MAG: SapC family protein [Alphaproteobacteria bacterium]|nr:SapC family protein [Alphaproteobacteria bacterium]
MSNDVNGAAQAVANPQFYRQPAAVNRERHAGKSLRDAGFAFSAGANAVALNMVEMTHAGSHYPIVFTTSAPAFPIAVLGLREGRNLFLNADGTWRAGTYIPAYLRRYPFIFAQTPGSSQLTLCVDEAAPHLVDGSDRPLFQDGKPTDHTDNALKFCMAFEAEREKTIVFSKAIEASGILVENRADVNLAGGEKLHIGGYRVIDAAKLDALPESTFLEWRRSGWLAPLYAHLVSLGCWQSLLGLMAAKPPAGGSASMS